jgi:8-oxo-dGTP pyrophosphatase MutT (NUDIX family)
VNKKKTITVALAIITNDQNDILVVRKKNGLYFALPGGKIETTETANEALIRELNEELNLSFDVADFTFLGNHTTTAANEVDTMVEGHIFLLNKNLTLSVSGHAEIEEVLWLSKANHMNYRLAHLFTEFALSKWLSETL